MDRRRFEEAFLLYAVLRTVSEYAIELLEYPQDRNVLLAMITNEFHEKFVQRWRSKSYPIFNLNVY